MLINNSYASRMSFSAIGISRRLISHRHLLIDQLRRELLEQHAGQIAGGLWLIIQPIFLMGIYVFVFSFVFQSRIGGTADLPLDYTSYILCGLVPWLTIQQAMSKSTLALTQNASLIKQVVFPVEVIPVCAVLASFGPFCVMLLVLIAYVLLSSGLPHATYLLLPVLTVFMAIWVLGIGFILSSIAVFVRDMREVVAMFLTAGLFLLPIIYLPQSVPPLFKPLIYINPFSYIVWCFQDALYFGRIEHPWAWLVMIFGGILTYMFGCRVFERLRPYFGDTL